MKLTINGHIARWEEKQAVAQKPFDIEIIGLREGVEWYYATESESNRLRGSTLRLNVNPGILKISFAGYLRGRKIIEIFAEPLILVEQETNVFMADPIFEAITNRLNELNNRLTQAEATIESLKDSTKANSDRISIVENEYDILKI